RFSKPSPSLLEKGRLSGSAQTRSSLGSSAFPRAASRAIAAQEISKKPLFTRVSSGCRDDDRCQPGGRHRSRLRAYFEATFWLRPKTVSTPPCVLNLSASPKAPRAPRPAVGSSLLIPAATPMPAQPPIPERTATYCLPSGPRNVIGLPMIPEGVLNFQSSLPVDASTAFSQPSIVP